MYPVLSVAELTEQVTLSETVESLKGYQSMQAADIEISKEDRDARENSNRTEGVALSDTHSVSGLVLSLRGITSEGRSALVSEHGSH